MDVGLGHRNPGELDLPEIGDEVAVARAFAELSNRMLACAAVDIEETPASAS